MVPNDTAHNRRTVLRAAGGLAGLSALSGRTAAETGSRARNQETAVQSEQQQTDGERIGMGTASGDLQVFTAPVVWIESGTTVTWVVRSGPHSTTAYAPANDKPRRIPDDAEAWDSDVLGPQGATFERAFDVEGVYDYYCIPHESRGMVGRVIVGEPELEDQPALSEPQSSLPDTVQEVIRGLNALTLAIVG